MKKYILLFVATLGLLLLSCNNQKQPLIIVSKEYKNQAFHHWLMSGDSNIKIISVYGMHNQDSIRDLLRKADGIIITGGEDINPSLYGQPAEIKRCGTVNNYRDSLEIMLIKYATTHKIPLLGICRGHQIINVALGGSLIVDIPQDIGSDTLHRKNGHATMHMVYIMPKSLLHNIVKIDSGLVRSNHHQAVKTVGHDLLPVAFAPDSVIEACEPVDTTQQFILTLQWHPEGMDYASPLSYRIRDFFLHKVKSHNKNKDDEQTAIFIGTRH